MFMSRGKMFMMALTLLGIVTSLHWPAVVQGGGGGERCTSIVRVDVDDAGVMIDIEPEEDEDSPSINPHSQGKLRIAVLSTDAFDATRIDSDKAHFGPFMALPYHAVEEDVNGDGLLDLLLKFHSRDTGIQCGATFAELTAETFPTLLPNGTCIVQDLIRGDTFQTVQCHSE